MVEREKATGKDKDGIARRVVIATLSKDEYIRNNFLRALEEVQLKGLSNKIINRENLFKDAVGKANEEEKLKIYGWTMEEGHEIFDIIYLICLELFNDNLSKQSVYPSLLTSKDNWCQLIYLIQKSIINPNDEEILPEFHDLMKNISWKKEDPLDDHVINVGEEIVGYAIAILGVFFFQEEDYFHANKLFEFLNNLNFNIENLEWVGSTEKNMGLIKSVNYSVSQLWSLQKINQDYEEYFSTINRDKFELNILPELKRISDNDQEISPYFGKLIQSYQERDSELYADTLRKVIEVLVNHYLFNYFINIEPNREFYYNNLGELEFKSCIKEFEIILSKSRTFRNSTPKYNIDLQTQRKLNEIIYGLRCFKIQTNPFGHGDFNNQYRLIRLFGLSQLLLGFYNDINNILKHQELL